MLIWFIFKIVTLPKETRMEHLALPVRTVVRRSQISVQNSVSIAEQGLWS